jgi:hypothetical protein
MKDPNAFFNSVSARYTEWNESRKLKNEERKFWQEAAREKQKIEAQQQKEYKEYLKEREIEQKKNMADREIWKKKARELEEEEFEGRKSRHEEYFRNELAKQDEKKSLRNAVTQITNSQYRSSLRGHLPKTVGLGGGGSQSKEILGKQRRIYKVAGSRKEHIKYKGQLIPVSDYKKLMKPKH